MKVATFPCDLATFLDHVLQDGDGVSHPGKCVVPHVDLRLSCGRHLVVVLLDDDVEVFNFLHHLGANVLESVERWRREVAFLVAWAIGQVVAAVYGRLNAGVPEALIRVDNVVTGVDGLVEPGRVENEEFGFGTPVAGVSDSAIPQVRFGFLAPRGAGSRE